MKNITGVIRQAISKFSLQFPISRRDGRFGIVGFILFLLILSLVFSPVLEAFGPITSMDVSITTSDVFLAGTDNNVYLRLDVQDQPRIEINLDNTDKDDFERGNTDHFTISGFTIPDTCNLLRIGVFKTKDDFNGGWHFGGITLSSGGQQIHTESDFDVVLENKEATRTWWSSAYVPAECPPPVSSPPPPPARTCQASITVCRPFAGVKDFALDSDCDGIPDECDTDNLPRDSDRDGIPDTNEDYNGNGTVELCESDPNNPDTNGNGILDGYEDADQDGLPDWYEDVNRNCQVDPGECDPNMPDANDSDGDGIVNCLEDDLGSSQTSSDTDGDGWYDGPRNKKTVLYLTEIKAVDVQEDAVWDVFDGQDDELFVTFNHARMPLKDDLEGKWEMSEGSSVYPGIVAATRIWSSATGTNQDAVQYSVRMDVREDDFFDWSDDDFALDKDIAFTMNNETFTHTVENDWEIGTSKYVLTFNVINTWFADPNPTRADVDTDRDGLTEQQEFNAATMLNGVADLSKPDIYMELDWQAGQQPQRYSKEDIVTRFEYKGYSFHLDDGAFRGGGKVDPLSDTDSDDEVSFDGPFPSLYDYRNQYFDITNREGIFRYALSVENVKNAFGWSSTLIKDENGATLCGRGDLIVFSDSDFMNYVSDFESIEWIHEFGHNLGLCHLPGDCNNESVAVGPGGGGGCTSCPTSGSDTCNCTHYDNSRWNDSAMGSCVTFPWVDDWIQAIDREIDFADSEWKAIDLTPITGP